MLITCQQPVVPSVRQQLDTAIEAVGAMEAARAIGGENATEAVRALGAVRNLSALVQPGGSDAAVAAAQMCAHRLHQMYSQRVGCPTFAEASMERLPHVLKALRNTHDRVCAKQHKLKRQATICRKWSIGLPCDKKKCGFRHKFQCAAERTYCKARAERYQERLDQRAAAGPIQPVANESSALGAAAYDAVVPHVEALPETATMAVVSPDITPNCDAPSIPEAAAIETGCPIGSRIEVRWIGGD